MSLSEKVWSTLLVALGYILIFFGLIFLFSDLWIIGTLLLGAGPFLLAFTLYRVAARDRKRNAVAEHTYHPYHPGPAGTITKHPEELGWPD